MRFTEYVVAGGTYRTVDIEKIDTACEVPNGLPKFQEMAIRDIACTLEVGDRVVAVVTDGRDYQWCTAHIFRKSETEVEFLASWYTELKGCPIHFDFGKLIL